MFTLAKRLVSAVTLAAALAPAWAWADVPADADRYAYQHMMWWGDGGGYGMVFGPLFMILIIALIVLFARWLGGPWHAHGPYPVPPGRNPIDILKERFARGEIDKDEFEERRRVLGDH